MLGQPADQPNLISYSRIDFRFYWGVTCTFSMGSLLLKVLAGVLKSLQVPWRLRMTSGDIFGLEVRRTVKESPVVSLKSAMAHLEVSRSTLYRMIASGELERVYIGGRPRITARSIERYVDYQLESSGAWG